MDQTCPEHPTDTRLAWELELVLVVTSTWTSTSHFLMPSLPQISCAHTPTCLHDVKDSSQQPTFFHCSMVQFWCLSQRGQNTSFSIRTTLTLCYSSSSVGYYPSCINQISLGRPWPCQRLTGCPSDHFWQLLTTADRELPSTPAVCTCSICKLFQFDPCHSRSDPLDVPIFPGSNTST